MIQLTSQIFFVCVVHSPSEQVHGNSTSKICERFMNHLRANIVSKGTNIVSKGTT